MIPLFRRYPALKDRILHFQLGDMPTGIHRARNLGRRFGVELYIKRDDQTGTLYGGNKVRKLEFLLADALRKSAMEVLTFGCAGSNHATATALYANRLGLGSISMLFDQPNSHSVRKNLLLSFIAGANLNFIDSSTNPAIATAGVLYRQNAKIGRYPYVIPAGGSSPLGTLGFVNAGFELKEQVDEGVLPKPDYIYVAAGTMGTAMGLKLGLAASGLDSTVVPVRVTGEKFASEEKCAVLFNKTAELLKSHDESFPSLSIDDNHVGMRHDHYGEKYALFTEESVAAVRMAKEYENIQLEGTYTGKAMAALLDDGKNGALKGKNVLFWDTYNSRDVSPLIEHVNYRLLPDSFHRYFIEDVQPLDRRHN